MTPFWLQWIAAFLIVIGILSVGVGVTEWWKWRKEQ
jgi:uncharacterized membrane protein YidH (DUF202 family)